MRKRSLYTKKMIIIMWGEPSLVATGVHDIVRISKTNATYQYTYIAYDVHVCTAKFNTLHWF